MRNASVAGLRAVASVVLIGTGCTSGSTIASQVAPRSPSTVLAGNEVTLVARLLEVADTRRIDTVVVDQALSSRVSYVRALGVRVIGQNAIAARARVLPTLVFDADTAVAAEAAFALGRLRKEESLAHLTNALGQTPSVAVAAAWSLAEIGGTAGRRIFGHVLTTGEPQPALVTVLESAAKLRPVPSELITPYLAHSDANVQRAAAYAVTRSRVAGSVHALIDFANRAYRPSEVAEDRAIDLWSYVGRGLAWPAAGDSLGEARSVLVKLAADPHPHVRINALRALATYINALNDARVAALRVIAAAWRNDSVAFPRTLRDSLAATRPPTDPNERAIGRGVAPLGHWPNAGPLPRPSPWYLAAVRSFVLPDLAGRPIRATILTSRGPIQIRFYGADAPLTVANFVSLAGRGYYDGLSFHRVVPNFVAQDGDPRGDGSGSPGYAIRDELNRRWYDRGALGMALSGPDTGGSQYFMAHSPQPHLDGHYTVFGPITDGFDALDAVVQGDAIVSVVIR